MVKIISTLKIKLFLLRIRWIETLLKAMRMSHLQTYGAEIYFKLIWDVHIVHNCILKTFYFLSSKCKSSLLKCIHRNWNIQFSYKVSINDPTPKWIIKVLNRQKFSLYCLHYLNIRSFEPLNYFVNVDFAFFLTVALTETSKF